MKAFVILFGCVVFVSAVKQELFHLPKENQQNLQKAGTACAAEHNVDPGLLPRIADGTLPRDDVTNKYFHCIAVKTNLIYEDGRVVVDKIVALIGDHPLVEEFRQALTKCNEVVKENPIATIVEFNRCYVNTSPVLIVL